MIGAGSVRVVALGALCVLGIYGPAKASSRHPSHGAAAPAAGFQHHAGRSAGGHVRMAMGSGEWLRTEGWLKTAHGGRFATRFRGFNGAFAARTGHSGGGIQCVTFARADTGIELDGNASAWWDHAAGLYQRGNAPEAGSVLNFRANGAMRMGHVAVVETVVNSRSVVVDHANWGGPGAVRGGISRSISVVDVSPSNDWTAVRVGLGHSGEYGSIYPTFGFIYNRPDRGVMVASAQPDAGLPAMNPAPRDLRGSARYSADEEVAEAPEGEGHSYAYRGGSFNRHRHVFMIRGESVRGHRGHEAAMRNVMFRGHAAGHSSARHRHF